MSLKIEDLKAGDAVRDSDGDTYTVVAFVEHMGIKSAVIGLTGSPNLFCRQQKKFDTYESEIVEPVKFVYLNVYADGLVYPYPSRARADEAGSNARVACQKIKIERGRYDD